MTSFFKGTNRGLYGDNARKPPFSPVIVSSRFHRVRQALPIVSHRLFSSPCPTVTSEVASSSLVHPATKLLVSPLNGLAFLYLWDSEEQAQREIRVIGVSFRRSSLQFNIRPWRIRAGQSVATAGVVSSSDSLSTRVAPDGARKKGDWNPPQRPRIYRDAGEMALCPDAGRRLRPLGH